MPALLITWAYPRELLRNQRTNVGGDVNHLNGATCVWPLEYGPLKLPCDFDYHVAQVEKERAPEAGHLCTPVYREPLFRGDICTYHFSHPFV